MNKGQGMLIHLLNSARTLNFIVNNTNIAQVTKRKYINYVSLATGAKNDNLLFIYHDHG